MTRLRSLGLRTRLAIALVAVAALAIGLATLLSHRGLHPGLRDAAEAHLERSAGQVAAEAVDLYARDGGWTPAELHSLQHLALLNHLTIGIRRPDGTELELSATEDLVETEAAPSGFTTTRQVTEGGVPVATITVRPLTSASLIAEESALEGSLNRPHLAAGAISAAAALVLAFVLAQMLARPLRRIRDGADRIAAGDLDTRIEASGGAELAAVSNALNGLARTLQREEELRKESVANVAHEFRTPVSGLLSRIEAAQDGVLEDEDANLAAMHGEALRLARLIDDLSQLAEAQRPDLLLRKTEVDLAEVAMRIADAFRPQFEEKGIALTLDAEPARLAGDADRLGQVLSNLLSNALRYTPRGGFVEIRVRATGATVTLEVRDTGIGIAPDDRERIFDRFWRAEKSRSRATGGAGIGLAIVRELVLAHGGTVEVISALGVGSRFKVTLPIRLPRRAPGRPGATALPPGPVAPRFTESSQGVRRIASRNEERRDNGLIRQAPSSGDVTPDDRRAPAILESTPEEPVTP